MIWAWVKLVIAAPGLATSSNWPPVTPDTVNWRVESRLSASVAESSAAPRTTVPLSLIVRALLPNTGASLTGVTVRFTVTVFEVWPATSLIV